MTQEYHDKMSGLSLPSLGGDIKTADHGDLVNFAEWYFSPLEHADAGDVIAFFEKPWKWADEYKDWKQQEEGDA